jgi:hypothetical protein
MSMPLTSKYKKIETMRCEQLTVGSFCKYGHHDTRVQSFPEDYESLNFEPCQDRAFLRYCLAFRCYHSWYIELGLVRIFICWVRAFRTNFWEKLSETLLAVDVGPRELGLGFLTSIYPRNCVLVEIYLSCMFSTVLIAISM